MTAWRKDQRPKDLNRLIADFRQRTKGRKWWIDDQASQTIDSIRFACESLKFKEGLDLIIIDNLQLIRSELDARQPRDVHYTAMSKALKVMAKKLDCVIVLLCQLDTEAATKRPTSANWASAKAIEGDANVALMIHSFVEREGDEPQFEIIGTKIRDGKPGFIPIRFDGLHQRFESEPVGEFAGDFQ